MSEYKLCAYQHIIGHFEDTFSVSMICTDTDTKQEQTKHARQYTNILKMVLLKNSQKTFKNLR